METPFHQGDDWQKLLAQGHAAAPRRGWTATARCRGSAGQCRQTMISTSPPAAEGEWRAPDSLQAACLGSPAGGLESAVQSQDPLSRGRSPQKRGGPGARVEGAARGRGLGDGAGRGRAGGGLCEPLGVGSASSPLTARGSRRSVLSPPRSLSAQLSARTSPPGALPVPAPPRPGTTLAPCGAPRAERSEMPRYELALILKAMQRIAGAALTPELFEAQFSRFSFTPPKTAAALKRTLEALMDKGAIVRNLENLGERALPYKITAHSQQHWRGGYFLVDFHAPTTTVESIMEHLSRDIDVIRPNIVKHPLTQEVKECEGIVPVPLEEKLYAPKKRK
ncbi:small ribosomal subunit protein bS6m [Cavia porcellus]